jgi:hypothetical protein
MDLRKRGHGQSQLLGEHNGEEGTVAGEDGRWRPLLVAPTEGGAGDTERVGDGQDDHAPPPLSPRGAPLQLLPPPLNPSKKKDKRKEIGGDEVEEEMEGGGGGDVSAGMCHRWLIPPIEEEISTTPSTGGREGVEPARTGFEEEEEHVTDDGRRHRATTAISTSPTLLFPVGGVCGPYLRQI